jgi:hypothetical protein
MIVCTADSAAAVSCVSALSERNRGVVLAVTPRQLETDVTLLSCAEHQLVMLQHQQVTAVT